MSSDTTHDVVALAGDWHGNTRWAISRIQSLRHKHDIELILHLGDFSLWPGREGERYLDIIERTCAKYGVEIWVTPGNHEDWGRLASLWSRERRPLRLRERVVFLPRNHRFELTTSSGTTRSFVSLGGAPSLDYGHRVAGVDWWREEALTPADVRRCVADGYADVMLVHDAPDLPYAVPAVAEMLQYNPLGWPDAALAYAAEGRRLMNEAFLGVAPRLFAHGHYHVRGTGSWHLPGSAHETTIWALHCDGMAGNTRLLDLESLGDPMDGELIERGWV